MDKWTFVKQIWKAPTDANLRLVYADYLQEIGSSRAANRQRNNARLVRDADLIFYNKRTSYIVGITPGNRRPCQWRMKRDGEIHPYSPRLQLTYLHSMPQFYHRLK